jgi:glycosyltransferase involved in cell wall biosynthesis
MSKTKVTVTCWDVGHNALGRAYVVADLLRDEFDVEIVGSQFVSYGIDVWRPLRDAEIPIRTFPGTSLPDHFKRMGEIAHNLDSDIVYVSKPRFPSLGLGILAKEARRRSLLVDVDDLELSFFGLQEASTLDEVASSRHDPDFVKPFGRIWTRYCDSLVEHADRVTVSNEALARRYGGTIIPHARDEERFDPAKYDRAEVRARLGFAPDERVVLFGGTARLHKGVGEIVRALREIGDPRNRLCVFNTSEYQRLATSELSDGEGWIRELPPQSFHRLPEVVLCADLVCTLQDVRSEISQYQIPAKITDAIAMGVPCLARRVPSLEGLIAKGAIEVLDPADRLTDALERMLEERERFREQALARRAIFLEGYSYGAVRPVLKREVERALEEPGALHPEFKRLIAFNRSNFSSHWTERFHAPSVDGAWRSFSVKRRTRSGDRRPAAAAAGLGAEWAEEAQRSAALANGEAQRLASELRRQVLHLDQILGRQAEIEGIRTLVSSTVPKGASIVIASKGDPELVALGEYQIWHFPSDNAGNYAGYHPADSEEAIEHLKGLCANGAEYFVLPKSLAWWKDQYSQFWHYLISTFESVGNDERSCAVFRVDTRQQS